MAVNSDPGAAAATGAGKSDNGKPIDWVELLGGEPLPASAQRLQHCRRLLGGRHSSLGDIAALIRADAALSLHLLRRVNRVRYDNGRDPDVLSVEIAANLLGEHALRDCLASCPELDQRLPPDGAHDSARQVYLRQLDRARLSAAVAEAAALARGDRSAGELYMLALLRGVPALALGLQRPRQLAELRRLAAAGLSLNAAASRVLGMPWEALLQQLLVQRWHLPATLSPADGWPADAGQRDIGPLIAGELVARADVAGWHDSQFSHCEYLLGEYLWADRHRARAVWQHALLAAAHSGDWCGDARMLQSLLDPPPQAAPAEAPAAVPPEPVPAQPIPAQPIPAQPIPAQPVPEQAAPEQAVPEQAVSAEVAPTRDGDGASTEARQSELPKAESAAANRARNVADAPAQPASKRALAAAIKLLRAQQSSPEPDVSQVLRALLHGLTDGVGLASAGIFVIDRSDDLLRARAVHGCDAGSLRELRLQRDQRWLTGQVLRKPCYLHVDPATAERWRARIPAGLREIGWQHDFLAASLFAGERPLALLLARGELLRDADSAVQARGLYKLSNRALANYAALKFGSPGPGTSRSAAKGAAPRGARR